MLSLQEIRDIVGQCSYEDWLIEVKTDDTRPYLQVHVLNGKDADTGAQIEWTGRKWMLSQHMVKNEIVTTAFKAVMTAVEHEVRENFRYRRASIFNPHIDPDAMVDFVNNARNMQARENVEFAA